MPFKKAEPEQAALKVSMYGPPGSGKTFTTLLMAEGLAKETGKRIAYVDTERGTDFYAVERPGVGLHPEAFDFDAVYSRSLAEVDREIRNIDPEVYGAVVLDSVSHMWDAAIESYEGRKTSQDGIPMQAWGKIKKPYKALIQYLMETPFHVFILGRQKNIFEGDSDSMRKVGVGMRAEGETAYEPHICVRMEARQDVNDSTRTTYLAHVEKDRSQLLEGRTVANPGFLTIKPILALLGTKQAKLDDQDERVAADSELLDRDVEKARTKETKSADILADMQVKIAGAGTPEELGAVSAEIKKVKRYMVEAHLGALRMLYKQRADRLAENTMGEV